MSFYYRIDFDEDIKTKLLQALKDDSELIELINNAKEINKSKKKVEAIKKASDTRTKKTLEKIQNAINILKMENRKIQVYVLYKKCGVSIPTLYKYRDKFGY